MKINRIAYSQFKGINDTLHLDKPTLLTGSMGSGKSGRLLGPQFAVTGSTPAGDRTEAAVKFGAPRGFSVSVELDDGFRFTRGIKVDAQGGKVETILDISGQSSIGIRESDPIIKKHVGNFAPAFNIAAFLDLSPDKRRDFVLDLCAKGSGISVDKAEIVNRVLIQVCKSELGAATVELIVGDEPDLGDKLLSKLAADRREIVESLLPKLSVQVEGDLTTAIAGALTWAADVRKASKMRRDEGQAASRKMSEQKNEFEVVAATVGQLSAELDKARTGNEDIGQQIANQSGRQTAKESLEHDILCLKMRIESVKDQAQNYAIDRELLETNAKKEAQDTHRECEAKLAAHMQVKPDTASNLVVDIAASERSRSSAYASLVNLQNELQLCEFAYKRMYNNPWHSAKESIGRVFEYVDEIGPRAEAELRDLNSLIDRQIPTEECAEDLQPKMEKLSAVVNVGTAKLVEYDASLTELKEKLSIYEQTLSNWEQTAADLKSKRDSATRKVADIVDRIVINDNGNTKCLADVGSYKKELVDKESRLSKLLDEGGFIDVASLQEQRDGYSARILNLQNQIDSKTRYDVLVAELTKCTARAERQGNLHDIAKLFEVGIKTIRESVMADLVAPLVNRLDAFIVTAMPGHKAYCSLVNRRGKPEFDLGWIVDGERKISLDAMSGGETAIFCTGLSYALVMLSDAPLKLLLVEAAEVDEQATGLLLMALDSVRDDVSNIVFATNSTVPSYGGIEDYLQNLGLKSWNVVHCQPLLTEAEATF